ncbi:MAG: papain-like cysteine protease family protein [bacterium]|nr:papain-like cysteine protease family protein [bacterium]
MATEVSNMQELSSLADALVTRANEMEDNLSNLKSIVNKAHDYDGIDVTTTGNILKKNLETLSKDIKTAAKNIKSYSVGLNTLDTDDFTTQAGVFSLNNIGNFFTTTIPNYVETGVNSLATGADAIYQNIKNTVLSPLTMIVNSIKIVEPTSDDIIEETTREMPLYDQTDYSDVKYSTGTIATSGCGITSLAMVATYVTGQEWTPDKCAELGRVVENHPVDNVGSMLTAADKIGLTYEEKTTRDIMTSLEDGKVVIALVNNSGHFVVLKGLTEDGKVLVNDPYGPWQTEKNATGQNLVINENGYIVQNDINITAGRIWVFDGPDTTTTTL